MDVEADIVLQKYFRENEPRVDSWFNVISPAKSSIAVVFREILRTISQRRFTQSMKDESR